jgi:FkbM family methyltransferase
MFTGWLMLWPRWVWVANRFVVFGVGLLRTFFDNKVLLFLISTMKPILESLLLNYARHFPVNAGKYRLVEKFGRGSLGNPESIRQSSLKYGGYTMDCDIRKMLQRQFYFFGTYFLEERVIDRWCEIAKGSEMILDIGANAGIFSLAAAASNPTARIYAFEPTPEIAAHLRKTVKQNHLEDRLFIHECAVSSESGIAHLNVFSNGGDNEGMNFLTAERRSESTLEVPTISVDDFCDQWEITKVDLIKIDVQGNEPAVLAGAKKLLDQRDLPTIFTELNWNLGSLENCEASKTLDALEQRGYRFADPNGTYDFRGRGSWMHALSDVVAGPSAV